jgi:hypothetical protein
VTPNEVVPYCFSDKCVLTLHECAAIAAKRLCASLFIYRANMAPQLENAADATLKRMKHA